MKRKLLHEGVLLIILFFNLKLMGFGNDTHSMDASYTVTVTNLSDIVNGNILNIDALNNDPDPDGISFREALYAANGTSGLKKIIFHSSLAGGTITIAADGSLLSMSSGGLTIDGDINKDGTPDITFDGHLSQGGSSGPCLNIVSSSNTITGLNFVEFIQQAINVACPDALCGTKLFENIKIIKNTITSHRPDAGGITIAPLGLIPSSQSPMLSDITWHNFVIQGNTINTIKPAIFFSAATGGGDRNKMINFSIIDNHLISEESPIGFAVADANSYYHGIPEPIDYCENNLIDSVLIARNIIDDPKGQGIGFGAANYGNSDNILQNVKIDSNIIFASKSWHGITFTAGDDAFEGRPTQNNLIKNIEITHNKITQSWIGIMVMGGHMGKIAGAGVRNNRIENLLIEENEISDYTGYGIYLLAGTTFNAQASGNIINSVNISGNKIYQVVNPGSGVGIGIHGGLSYDGPTTLNIIQGLHFHNNQISNNETVIQVYGGNNSGAENNQVIFEEIYGNTLVNNTVLSDISDNYNGAKNNSVTPNIPSITSTTGGSRCGTGTVSLGATASEGTINWYSVSTGGIPLGSGTSFTTPILSSTTTYYVDAAINGCSSLQRSAVTATIECLTNINEYASSDRIKIYPNPTSGQIEININEPFDYECKIELLNNIGSLIKSIIIGKGENIIQFNLEGYPAGLYYIQFATNDEKFRKKIIKM
jgi:hypothetical protein